MLLVIADPPYPPMIGSGGRKNRASRWYGTGQRSVKDRPADQHPEAHLWDDPETHRLLLQRLMAEADGFAIATTPDGVAAYGPLPIGTRIMAWVKPNATPSSHRLTSKWEAVILYPPSGRRSSRTPAGAMSDVLICPAPRRGFPGAKPIEWTLWVLDALGYDPFEDDVEDTFHGSGAVAEGIRAWIDRAGAS